MAKIDLTSFEWRELVFQGKNKEYGAYTMRSESDKRHNRAMIIVAVVAVVGFSLPKLIEMVKPKYKETNTEVTQFAKLEKAEVKNDIKKVEQAPPPPELKSSIKFVAPVIKKDEEVKDENMKSQDELSDTKVAISVADVKGSEKGTVDIVDVKTAVTQEEEEKVYQVIEQMPVFPDGGEAGLLNYINKNIKYPVIAQENGIQGKVILRFVVSKTGMVDKVEIVRSLDPACDKEAIRVVKTLPKFIPGKQNGVNVAVWYTLPVTYRLE